MQSAGTSTNPVPRQGGGTSDRFLLTKLDLCWFFLKEFFKLVIIVTNSQGIWSCLPKCIPFKASWELAVLTDDRKDTAAAAACQNGGTKTL